MTATILDGKAFNRKLSGVVRRSKTLRDDIQTLLEDAQAFFYVTNDEGEVTCDATRFTDIVNKLHGTGVVATVKLCDYIETIAPVKRAGGKSGIKFKVNRNKLGDTYVIDKTWYEYNKEKQNEELLNVDKMVYALVSKLSKQVENLDPSVPEQAEQIEKAHNVIAALSKPAPENHSVQ